jgi:hypothetical protein
MQNVPKPGKAPGKPTMHKVHHPHKVHDQRKAHQAREEQLDQALDDSFPASDPPSMTSHTPSKADHTHKTKH